MNRLKLIVLSSALSLITIGVFAGRAKFVPQNVYIDRGSGVYTQLVTNSTFNDLSTNNPGAQWSQAKIVSSRLGTQFNLVTDDMGTKVPLYTQGSY